MLSSIGYTPVFGLPFVLWLGLATALSFISTAMVMVLTMNTAFKIPFVWHHRLAALSFILMVVHAALAIAIYF